MNELKEKYSIQEMANFLNVSRQSYYKWLNNEKSLKDYEDLELKTLIYEIFDLSGGTYGALRISKTLKKEG